MALGGLLVAHGGLAGWLMGLAAVGIGLNYLPLAIHGCDLIRAGRLERELADIDDLTAESRWYFIAQARLCVPGLVAILAVRRSYRA